MGIKALEGLTPEWYVPKSEEAEDQPTRFMIKPLNGEQYDCVLCVMDSSDGELMMTGESITTSLKYGLVGWENYSNSKGAVTFQQSNFKDIPYNIRIELARVIGDKSINTEAEKKT